MKSRVTVHYDADSQLVFITIAADNGQTMLARLDPREALPILKGVVADIEKVHPVN